MNIDIISDPNIVKILDSYNNLHLELLKVGKEVGPVVLLNEDIYYLKGVKIYTKYYNLLVKSYPILCITVYLTSLYNSNTEKEKSVYQKEIFTLLQKHNLTMDYIESILSQLK